MKQIVKVPQHIVDEHALIAQKYAGCLVGHPVRAARYTVPLPKSVDIDRTRPWVKPNPVQDGCLFCRRLTDEEAERRVFGVQVAIVWMVGGLILAISATVFRREHHVVDPGNPMMMRRDYQADGRERMTVPPHTHWACKGRKNIGDVADVPDFNSINA